MRANQLNRGRGFGAGSMSRGGGVAPVANAGARDASPAPKPAAATGGSATTTPSAPAASATKAPPRNIRFPGNKFNPIVVDYTDQIGERLSYVSSDLEVPVVHLCGDRCINPDCQLTCYQGSCPTYFMSGYCRFIGTRDGCRYPVHLVSVNCPWPEEEDADERPADTDTAGSPAAEETSPARATAGEDDDYQSVRSTEDPKNIQYMGFWKANSLGIDPSATSHCQWVPGLTCWVNGKTEAVTGKLISEHRSKIGQNNAHSREVQTNRQLGRQENEEQQSLKEELTMISTQRQRMRQVGRRTEVALCRQPLNDAGLGTRRPAQQELHDLTNISPDELRALRQRMEEGERRLRAIERDIVAGDRQRDPVAPVDERPTRRARSETSPGPMDDDNQ